MQAAAARPAYSCTPYHCFGEVTWPGSNNGAHTTLGVVQLYCTPGATLCGQGWFVDNEMWVNAGSYYWVEAGYSTYSNDHATSVDYFWADSRPNYGYFEHVLSSASSDYGNSVNLTIQRAGSRTFEVSLVSPNFSWVDYSTNNSMSPNSITIGQELNANSASGAWANTAVFTNNQYVNAYTNTFHYQSLNGNQNVQNPPHAGWLTYPSDSSTGGGFWTSCC